jgi:hypothetical protein
MERKDQRPWQGWQAKQAGAEPLVMHKVTMLFLLQSVHS